MALRNQPYLPLYVQDFLTDEKLTECSASSTGVYIRIMCLMHKSDQYGTILLRQKERQKERQVENFADKLAKHLPYDLKEIISALEELIELKVLFIDGDLLCQKRMIKDNEISVIRSESGKKGAKKTNKKYKKDSKVLADEFAEAKHSANTEDEIEYENEIEIEDDNKIDKKKKGVCNGEITLTSKFREIFNDFFKELIKNEFSWNGKEMKNLKDLTTKIQFQVKNKADLPQTDEQYCLSFKMFLEKINDDWILSHLSPSIINSKFNEILSSIKNKKNGKQPATSNEQLARIVADTYRQGK